MTLLYPKARRLFQTLALSIVACAASAEPVTSELTMSRVVMQRDGTEQLAPTPEVAPGDLLQYTATYRNTGLRAVSRLAATLPIPAGTEFVAAPDVSGPLQASLGGTVFEPVPLMRKHKRPDGQLVLVPVPLSEYRALRWSERELAPGGSVATSARVRVLAQAPQALPAPPAALPTTAGAPR